MRLFIKINCDSLPCARSFILDNFQSPVVNVKQKLLRLALLLSPLMAIYGVMPIYIFAKLDWGPLLQATTFLAVLIYVFWLINIFLLDYVAKAWPRFLLGYLLMVTLHGGVTLLMSSLLGDVGYKISLGIYPLLAILALNTFIFILIQSNLLASQKDRAELEVQNLKLSNLEVQKQVLLQQLQPHFLFNALSTLKSLIQGNPDEAEAYVLKLSEFLRYSVHNQGLDRISLREELQFTQDYIDLQKVRFGEALQVQIELSDSILKNQLPLYALQSLVENAIKHNAFTEQKPLHIKIEAVDNRLKISNNKASKAIQATSGTGLTNLQKRYELYHIQGLEVLDTDSTFIVYLNLIQA